MTFNSIEFVLFFISILIFSYSVPLKKRWIIGLAASFLFYALQGIGALAILIGSTTIDYGIGLYMARSKKTAARKLLLIMSLMMNLSLIFGFKYLNFFNNSLLFAASYLFNIQHTIQIPELITTLGISFYCFKKISYIADIYQGTIKPENHFGYFFLYVSHFLEITSGPIDRAKNLLPQLKSPTPFDQDSFRCGLLLALWGFFLKLVIADRLSLYTDAVFNNVYQHHGSSLLVAAYFYSFQIYCDFAGYTNIALGCGLMLGLKLAPNFNLPYFSKNISEFWRRWHMSLSFWFRDYLYIPLGGSRVSALRRYLNLLIVFLLCGLWHGANWTFIVWGGIHGIYLVIALISKKTLKRIAEWINLPSPIAKLSKIFITFHLVTFAWIFFRANSLEDACYFIFHLFSISSWPKVFIDVNSMSYGMIGITILLLVETWQYQNKLTLKDFFKLPIVLRWSCIYFLIFSIILAGVSVDNAFIYNQF